MGVVLLATVGMAPAAQADTVGLWLMEDFFDATPSPDPVGDPDADPPIPPAPDPAGGETIVDSGPNGLNFLAASNFGTVELTNDVSSVMLPGTSALSSNSGGAGGYTTPASSALSRGATGELTVEFWWKSFRVTPSVAYVLAFGPGGAGTGSWGIYSDSTGSLRFFEYSDTTTEVVTGAGASDGDWHHVAFTVDAAGVRTAYVDGNQVGQTGALGAGIGAVSDDLIFGSSPAFTFADHGFIMDELRISNVALLPGNGTGVDELAWNASLIPEPASLAMLAVGLAAATRRRRAA